MLSLALSVFAVAAVLLIPGYCLFRTVGMARTWSIALAPAVSVAIVSLLGEAYAIVGIDATPVSLVLIPSLVLAAIVAVRRFKTDAFSMPELHVWQLALYVFVGFAAGYLAFVRPMGSSDSYFRGVDLIQHLNEIRAFIDAKEMTSISQSIYLATPNIDPAPVHGFYPSGYHVVCALAAMICGQELTVIINACNLCACSLVWTLGLAAFFAYVFEDLRHAFVLGALVSVVSTIFPWGLLIFGPIFPNLLSFAFVPTVAVLFIHALSDGVSLWQRVVALLFMVIALGGTALTQPNAAFTAAVLLIPFVFSRILSLRGREFKLLSRPVPTAAVVVACLLWIAVCCGIWMFMLYLPALRGTVTFVWNFKTQPIIALANALAFTNVYSFGFVAAQPILGALALCGVIWTLLRKKLRWLSWTALLGQGLCFVCLTNNSPIKNLVGGFWYTDPWRMSCMAVMLTLPVVVLGLVWLTEIVERVFTYMHDKRAAEAGDKKTKTFAPALVKRMQPLPATLACALVAFAFIMTGFRGAIGTVYVPVDLGLIVPVSESGWKCLRRNVHDQYRLEAPYTHEERAFTREVVELIGDAVVINDPFDGSVISYGADGLNTYYRYVREYNSKKETEDSKYLRANLQNVATDEEVRRILLEDDVHYLIKLSHRDYHDAFYMGAEWIGYFDEIEEIDGNTPGFEEVLRQDDMVLYRITALDDNAD